MHIFLQKLANDFFEERSRWFSWLVVLFGFGVSLYFSLSFEPSIWITLIVIEVLVVVAYFCRFSAIKLMFVSVFAVVVLGFTVIQLKAYRLAKDYHHFDNEKMYLTGRVADVDYNYRGLPRITLEEVFNFDDGAIAGNIRINLMSKKHKPEIGQCVELVSLMYPPLEPIMVGGYQFNRKYFFDGLSATGSARSRVLITDCVAETPLKDKFDAFVFTLRERIVARIYSILPPDEASITAAIIAGERAGISHKLYNQYRDSGLAHFLSISGLHMSMLAGLMFFLVRLVIALIPPLALRYDSKKIAAWFAIVMSGIYLFISGMDIPAQRAFIMTLIVLLGVLISRKAISMLTISWAALVVLLISPEAIIGASFQMSFAAVVCLIAFYEKYAGALHRFLNRGGPLRIVWLYIGGVLVADLVASMATLPFAIYHFNRIALFTTLGNFLAGPVIGLLIMPFVLIALLLMPFGLEYVPLKIVGYGMSLVNDITHYVASLPNAGYQVVSMPTWGLVMIVLGGLWLCIWQRPWRKFGWIGIFIGTLSIFMVKSPDVIANNDVFAVKDNAGNLVVMPVRGTSFEKRSWLEKSASEPLSPKQNRLLKDIYKGKKNDKEWLDLECNKEECFYKGLVFKKEDVGQARSIWLTKRGSKVKTVEEYSGNRYWTGYKKQ